ncbi:aspartyl-phosphate phosphatase Spo0E family protein [Lysinibacillus composti]|nr:aspartyl-phosphate phosphatase Spo0E family protein [Lysinibacillus composti]
MNTLIPLELEKKFHSLQKRMISFGMRKGFTHPDTIKCSKELDVVINQIQIKNYK